MAVSMNIFRLGGDMLHLLSILIILLKIYTQQSCKGLSLKTQALYVLVFVTRYLDLFTNTSSMYNTIMKMLFIASSSGICYLMKFKEPYCKTYDEKHDSFWVFSFIIAPCAFLALIINEEFTFMEILWTFSIYVEAVAIVPQLIVVHYMSKENEGYVEGLTSDYVFTLGGYRALYLLNWIYRYFTEDDYSNWIVWIAGSVQTAIYCDFFYYYLISKVQGTKMHLPQ